MTFDPKKLTSQEQVRLLQANASRLGRTDIVTQCKRRLFELAGVNIDDPVEARLWQAVAAYEEILREKHGRRQTASYTRRKIEQKGAIRTLTDWALEPKVTPGFEALVQNDLAEFTGEFIVVEYSDKFPEDAVAAAREKLESHNIKL